MKSEIIDTLRPFYCALCEKQFQNVTQYDEHTNSYAHHHKARLQDMHANARPMLQEDVERRKEKERKREEKELRKLAKAAGIKMAKPCAAASPAPMLAPVAPADTAAPSNTTAAGFQKAGWATVNAPSETNLERTGWSSVGSGTRRPPSPPFMDDPKPPSPPVATQQSHRLSDAPSFRRGGWATLDTRSSDASAPPPSYPTPPPPPSDPVPPPPDESLLSPPPPLLASGFKIGQVVPTPPVPKLIPSSPATPTSLPSTSQDTKSGWQQWKQNKNFRRK